MRRPVFVLWVLILAILGVNREAIAEETVELKDLGVLEEASLEILREVHHRYLVAEIALAGAKMVESGAKKEVEEAKKIKQAEEADLKAAKAELEAAKKNNDSPAAVWLIPICSRRRKTWARPRRFWV